jgi:hypothetical protein
MPWSINDRAVVLCGLKLPQGDINGDTTLTLGLQLVEDPCVLEGTLAEFGGFLLWLLVMSSVRVLGGVASFSRCLSMPSQGVPHPYRKFATRRGVVAGQRDMSSRQGGNVPE